MAANPTTENPTTFARVPALVAPVEVVAAAAEPVELPFVVVLLLAPLATAPLVVEAFPDVVVTVEMPPIPLTKIVRGITCDSRGACSGDRGAGEVGFR
jgi:hypothetical protein